jgi:hypothetical protein
VAMPGQASEAARYLADYINMTAEIVMQFSR